MATWGKETFSEEQDRHEICYVILKVFEKGGKMYNLPQTYF